MRLTLLVTLLSVTASAQRVSPRFDRFCSRTEQGRSERGFGCDSLAFFEFANAAGTGMGAACAGTAITGAKGEAVTVTRASSAYCTKEGLATTGLTTTSMVLISSNLPRVESDGTALGLLVEEARTNDAIQSEAFDNAAWTSTATVTANTTTTPWNTLTGDTLTDVSAVAIQSSCQTITTASATQHSFSVYLQAGSLTNAGISMTGTGSSTGDCTAAASGLASTWTRVSCASPATYAGTLTSVTVCVTVGNVAANTGTIIVAGAQHENTAAYGSSYIATTTVAATRAGESTSFNGASLPGAPLSLSAYVTTEWAQAAMPVGAGIIEGQIGTASGAGLFLISGNLRFQTLNVGAALVQGATNFVAGVTRKVGGSNSGGNSSVFLDGVLLAGPTATNNTATPWNSTTGIGYTPAFPQALNGIISRLKVDNTATGGL